VTGYVLSRSAESDPDEIWDYSSERWGSDQANRYVGALRESMERVALDPSRGRSVSVRGKSYYRYRSGSHMILYRETNRGVQIVRVLHQSMEYIRHLR
jgi:toxin ParE1/3/4